MPMTKTQIVAYLAEKAGVPSREVLMKAVAFVLPLAAVVSLPLGAARPPKAQASPAPQAATRPLRVRSLAYAAASFAPGRARSVIERRAATGGPVMSRRS